MTTAPDGCALCVARNKLFHKLADEAEGLELRLKFWRAKDAMRRAGENVVRKGAPALEAFGKTKRLVRALRAELKAKGLRP